MWTNVPFRGTFPIYLVMQLYRNVNKRMQNY